MSETRARAKERVERRRESAGESVTQPRLKRMSEHDARGRRCRSELARQGVGVPLATARSEIDTMTGVRVFPSGKALDAKVKGRSGPTGETEMDGNIHRGGIRDERWKVGPEMDRPQRWEQEAGRRCAAVRDREIPELRDSKGRGVTSGQRGAAVPSVSAELEAGRSRTGNRWKAAFA